MRQVILVLISKAFRVFVFGIVSIAIPIYLAENLGQSSFNVFIAITVIVMGNIFSNVLLTWYGNVVGRKRILFIFSALMFVSGILLFSTTNYLLILFACFIGNISTTGTEAGPFQSVETGVLPKLVVSQERVTRSFGYYNLIGYGASSVGALTASLPSYFQNSTAVFHYLFLFYGLVGLLLLLLYQRLGNIEDSGNNRRAGLSEISGEGRANIRKLSALSSIDAFGGGFVSQSILSYWFYYVYHVSLASDALIFFVASVITGASTLGASFIAEKLGNLRTMVYTHLISSIFLVAIPLAGSLLASLAFLFLRQSLSQMDVPTRQAFFVNIFDEKERVSANAITNTFRSVGSVFGSPLTGVMFAASVVSLPILTGGVSKIVYDVLIFFSYKDKAK